MGSSWINLNQWMMMDDVRGCNQVDWMCWSERRTTFLTLRRICQKPSYSRMWTLHSVLKVWEQPALAMYMHDMTLTILDQLHQKCTRMIRNHGTQSSVVCLLRVFIPIHQTCYGPRHLVLLTDASLQSVAGTLDDFVLQVTHWSQNFLADHSETDLQVRVKQCKT